MSDMHYPISNLFTEHQQSVVKRARELWDLFEPHHIMERSLMMSELYVIISRLLGEIAVRDSKLTVRDNELAEKQVDLETAIAERDAAVKQHEEQQKRLDDLLAQLYERDTRLIQRDFAISQAQEELDAVKKKLATARTILYHVFLHGNSDRNCKYCKNVDQITPDVKEAYERSEFERE